MFQKPTSGVRPRVVPDFCFFAVSLYDCAQLWRRRRGKRKRVIARGPASKRSGLRATAIGQCVGHSRQRRRRCVLNSCRFSLLPRLVCALYLTASTRFVHVLQALLPPCCHTIARRFAQEALLASLPLRSRWLGACCHRLCPRETLPAAEDCTTRDRARYHSIILPLSLVTLLLLCGVCLQVDLSGSHRALSLALAQESRLAQQQQQQEVRHAIHQETRCCPHRSCPRCVFAQEPQIEGKMRDPSPSAAASAAAAADDAGAVQF